MNISISTAFFIEHHRTKPKPGKTEPETNRTNCSAVSVILVSVRALGPTSWIRLSLDHVTKDQYMY